MRFIAKACLGFFVYVSTPFFVANVYAADCAGFSVETFQNLSNTKAILYDQQVPIRDEILSAAQGEETFSYRIKRFVSRPGFDYSFKGRSINNEARVEEIIVRSAYRKDSDISGRWSMFLDYLKMEGKVKTGALGTEMTSLASPCEGCQIKVIRKNVENEYLLPLIKHHYQTNPELGHSISFQPEDSFFGYMTDIGPDGETHNGTQTIGFMQLLKYHINDGGDFPLKKIDLFRDTSRSEHWPTYDLTFVFEYEATAG